ncbi:MAG: biosynthetic peptidoglycan transglycosylase [Anaerolineae bacterium]
MADSPSNNNDVTLGGQTQGGWRKPQSATAAPPSPAPIKSQTGGWRVPVLPQNVPSAPSTQGDWHLPKPEDTIFTERDETEIPAERQQAIESRPEDFLENFQLTSQQPAEQEEVDTEASPQPIEPEAEKTDSQSLLDLELGDVIEATGADEDDDDDTFSMSELIALSSLVEKTPKSDIVPKQKEPVAETGPQATTGQTGADDPAAYARKQLELLQGTSAATSTADDAAAYARKQLEALSGTSSAPAQAGLTPKQQELAQKFNETQTQVRVLRGQYQAGQLTRDQLQEQLKRLMILDENNVWWMMGVETDTWYRFQNNEWVIDTPPYAGQPARTPTPTITSQLDPSQVIQGSLPYLPSEPIQSGNTQPSAAFQTGGFGISEELGLPRQNVPINDPDRTLVSEAGYNFGAVRPGEAPTVQNLGGFGSQPTQVNQRVDVGFDQYGNVAAPIPGDQYAEAAPDYTLDKPSPVYEDVARQQQQRTVRTVLTLVGLGVGALLLLFACGIGFILIQYNSMASQFQPQIAALANYQPVFQTVKIQDVNGNQIALINSQEGGARTTVPLNKISDWMIHAVVSLENERFFEDPGWDWVAIGRAFIQNISAGQIESGASTITQQIAEQLILKTPTNTPALKLQEIVIASEIAKQYSKEKILELYLNEIFFGNQSYGVEAAAQFYFNTSAQDLNSAAGRYVGRHDSIACTIQSGAPQRRHTRYLWPAPRCYFCSHGICYSTYAAGGVFDTASQRAGDLHHTRCCPARSHLAKSDHQGCRI